MIIPALEGSHLLELQWFMIISRNHFCHFIDSAKKDFILRVNHHTLFLVSRCLCTYWIFVPRLSTWRDQGSGTRWWWGRVMLDWVRGLAEIVLEDGVMATWLADGYFFRGVVCDGQWRGFDAVTNSAPLQLQVIPILLMNLLPKML
jgi:hypothetical protein